MTISAVSSAYAPSQASADLKRMQNELGDLQRQTGSGYAHDDLKGYGAAGGRVISARGLIAQTESRIAAAGALRGRLETTDVALGQAADAAEDLRLGVLKALGDNGGPHLGDFLQRAFDSARTALNTRFEEEALFAGERVDARPIQVESLAALAAVTSVDDIYDEAAREKTIDLGEGAFAVAERASDLSRGLFEAMRSLQILLDNNGGTLPGDLTDQQRTDLTALADDLGDARERLLLGQGRNGMAQTQTAAAQTRLQQQSDALTDLLGELADADLGEVAMQLSARQTQYRAAAEVFSQVSRVSLLDYL